MSRLFAIAALAILTPALVNIARQNPALLQTAGARAAIAAAAINMPDGGIELIKERFRNELYGVEEEQKNEDAENPGTENHAPEPQQERDEPEPIPGAEQVKPLRPPKIPDEYAAPLISEDFAGKSGGTLIQSGRVFIKNDTKEPDEKIEELLRETYNLGMGDNSEPQALLFHTHATESFERYDSGVYDTRNTWRSTDNNNNMVTVGSAMLEVLEEEGINALHDTVQHDYPSYNGSYERSAVTVKKYLEEYPSVKIALDLHRDAMQREETIVKPVTVIDGKKAAQIMIIAGCDDGGMNMPDWPENLRFAAALQEKIEEMYPGLMRPIYLCYRKYNMDLSNGSLLLEFGSNANTLEEAVYSAQLAGKALAELIKESEQG